MLADLTQVRVAPTLHWIEDFGAWLHEHDRMPKTIEAYLQDLRHFSKFFEQVNHSVFAPDQLNATDVKAYFRHQDDDLQVAVNSRNRRLASLRVMVKWAVEIGILEYDPTVSIQRKSVELLPRDRSDEEISLLDAVVRDGLHVRCAGKGHAWLAMRDRVMWELFKRTGLRIHEIAALTPEHFDFDTYQLTIIGKGNKKAIIKVQAALIELLSDWIALNPSQSHLLCNWDGEVLHTEGIRDRIRMIGEAAGIHDLKPHDLRHTYAFHLMDTAMSQGMIHEHAKDLVRRQLRHGDSKTTDLYFRVRDSQIRAAVEAM
jgi:integrase/recombinase XerC